MDLLFGGLIYFFIGFGLSYGTDISDNGFMGFGNFALTGVGDRDSREAGLLDEKFLFQVESMLENLLRLRTLDNNSCNLTFPRTYHCRSNDGTPCLFQLSFATATTTIVSGAVAERIRFSCYIVFAMTNIFAYCIPAHWLWDSRGFLRQLGAVDVAGSGWTNGQLLYRCEKVSECLMCAIYCCR